MKKKYFVSMIVVILSITSLLSACGKSINSDASQGSNSPSAAVEGAKETESLKKVEFSWMAHTAYSMQGSDPKRVDYLKSSVDEFQKAHPNVTVDSSESYDGSTAALLIRAASNRMPDAAMIDAYMMPKFYQYLQPLDSYFEEAGLKMDDFFPFAQNVMKGPDGKIYGIQFTTDIRVLYYRTDLVPTPPKSWDEVIEMGKTLKSQGYDALLMPAGRAEASSTTVTLPLFFSQGGELVNEEGKAVFGEGENKDKMLGVYNFLKKAVDEGVIPKRTANIKAEADQNADIATGKVAMFFGGNWQVNQLKDLLGPDEFAKWAIAPIPTMSGDNHVMMSGGWAWGIFAKDPDKQQAAFDFLLQTFIGNKGMSSWSNIGGYMPTRKEVYEDSEFKGNEHTQTFKEYLEKYGKARPATDEYAKISEQLQVAVSSVVSGSLSPEKALDFSWRTLNQK